MTAFPIDSVFDQLENVEDAICFLDRVLRNSGAKSRVFAEKRKQLRNLQQSLCDRLEKFYVRGEW